MRIYDKLKNSTLGVWIYRRYQMLMRLWSLYFVPFANKIVLPGCSGVPMVQVFKHLSDRDIWQGAKALAFSFLMATPPLLIFFFTLIPYMPIEGIQNELLLQLSLILPEGLYERIASIITDVMSHKHSSLLSIGFATSIILAANGIHGLLQSFNSVSKSIEWRSLIHRYLLCLLLVLILSILVVAILGLLIGYKLIIQLLISQNFIAETKLSLFAFSIGRWLLLVFLTLLTLSLIYYIAPVKKQRINFMSIGSVISTLMIFGLSWAFQIYINNFNNYNILYGSIGTLLVFMLWVYANCMVILSGYAINIAIADTRKEKYKPSRKRRREQKRMLREHTPHYTLSTEDPNYRQPRGSNIYHSPSGISKLKIEN